MFFSLERHLKYIRVCSPSLDDRTNPFQSLSTTDILFEDSIRCLIEQVTVTLSCIAHNSLKARNTLFMIHDSSWAKDPWFQYGINQRYLFLEDLFSINPLSFPAQHSSSLYSHGRPSWKSVWAPWPFPVRKQVADDQSAVNNIRFII